jgi:ribose 5-phosphate isomerase B
MKVALASDHAGFALKALVTSTLTSMGHEVSDLGPQTPDRVDYPDYAFKVARAVVEGRAERAILICGSGIGMAIAANRHTGVRAANCTMEYQAEMCRRHNDANVLCLGERVVGPGLAESLVRVFMTSPFDGGRHADRVEKLSRAE